MDGILYIFIGIVLVILLYLLFPTRKIFRQNQKIKQLAEEIRYQNLVLEEQNKRLKELNREKNQVIGVVSHDLKSPLNRVFALSNLISMEADNLTLDQQDYINRIQLVVADGLGLIRNLLDIRAIEDKGIDLKIEEIQFQKFLQELKNGFSVVVKRKNIDLTIPEDRIVLQNDRQYLERIFNNILSNAVKYTIKGGKVEIYFESQKDFIVCSVSDEGPGIPENEAHNLYKKYAVLSTKPTDGESSTGLGLSIVKSLVEKLGGEVWHKNRDTTGTTFFVKLPLNVGF